MSNATNKPNKAASNLIAELAAARDDRGSAMISSKQTAVIIRDRLRREFPGTKFSVRSDCNSINIRWTDGPTQPQVDAVAGEYKFGGFDGMIDLAYSSQNWLHADGSMSHASTEGTAGSGGYISASATDCPEPGAVLVRYGPKYVFTGRELSDAHRDELVEAVVARYGIEVDADRPLWDQRHNGEYVLTMASRLEHELATA